jgi:hypothetical protein
MVVILLLGVLTIIFYRSPRYSLLMISNAVTNRDYDKFSKYVDMDSIVDNTIEDSMEETDEDDIFADWTTFLTTSLKETLEASIKTSIENGEIESGWMSEITFTDVLFNYKSVKNGKIVDITLDKDSPIEISMRQNGSHWEIIKLGNMEEFTSTETQTSDDETKKTIEKNIGDKVELTTLDFTVHSFEKVNFIDETWGDGITASEDNQLYKLDVTVHNKDTDSQYIDEGYFIIADSESYQYEIIEDSLWIDDKDSLYGEEIMEGLGKRGNLYFEIPESSTGLYIKINKRDTNETYIVSLD